MGLDAGLRDAERLRELSDARRRVRELKQDPDAGWLRQELGPVGSPFRVGTALPPGRRWICRDAEVEETRQVDDVAVGSNERARRDENLALARRAVDERS